MSALAQIATRDAYPLGRPLDGRERYGMTPEQAKVYRWLVANRPHDRAFAISFREVALVMARPFGQIHKTVAGLVERGWLERDDAGYRFVHPVMQFKCRA